MMMLRTLVVLLRDQILVRFRSIAEVSYLARFVMFKRSNVVTLRPDAWDQTLVGFV